MKVLQGVTVLSLLLSGSPMVVGCSGPAAAPDSVVVEYLGHASFLLTYPGGVTVLTDYGTSNAWGLNSPIYPLDGVVPDIATVSHAHEDHSGGQIPAGVRVLDSEDDGMALGGLRITPIPTYEGQLEEPDNLSFLFESSGLKILHLGDCQALMVALGGDLTGASVTDRIRRLYPDRYDLVFLPIGFTRDILDEAQLFISLLDASHVIPMHYWEPQDRNRFLALFDDDRQQSMGEFGAVLRVPGSSWTLHGDHQREVQPLIIGLLPGPPGARER